ncbi:MAG: hypothetical protein IJX16_00635 [Clostridia bacterium]|nr:hypothetical protein [Clostridia bacterium]
MNEKLQYATMLEIPVNTCNVTLKSGKKRRFGRKKAKNPDAVKEELMNKINSESVEETAQELTAVQEDYIDQITDQADLMEDAVEQENNEETATVTDVTSKPKRRFKFSVITAQFAIIGVLIATIFLTNAFYADSGINVFFKSVFGTNQTESVDSRTHQDFTPVLAVGKMTDITVDGGVMTFSGEGSVYAPCDGKITSVTRDGSGKYIFEITHSENFKSVISGLDYAYAGLDDTVYANIPVGYVNADGATMCFKSGEDLVISNYEIIDGSVVWAV